MNNSHRNIAIEQNGSRHVVPALNRHFPSHTMACRAIDAALRRSSAMAPQSATTPSRSTAARSTTCLSSNASATTSAKRSACRCAGWPVRWRAPVSRKPTGHRSSAGYRSSSHVARSERAAWEPHRGNKMTLVRQNTKHLDTPYYCAFERNPPMFAHRAVIWQYGGCIRGAHQPFVVDIMECDNDASLRMCVEWNYPGIDYAPVPQVINERLYA